MTKNTDSMKNISDYRTSIFDRMYFQGVLQRNKKERLPVQVMNAAHARP